MKKDILGKHELETLKLNWTLASPGLMTTLCCGTGTCDNKPDARKNGTQHTLHKITFSFDAKSHTDITNQYGYLRSIS